MISFLKKLIKNFYHPKIKMLGRSGILFTYLGEKYYVGSEGLTGNPDIVIYSEDIWIEGNRDMVLNFKDRLAIVAEVKSELESMGLTVEVHPI